MDNTTKLVYIDNCHTGLDKAFQPRDCHAFFGVSPGLVPMTCVAGWLPPARYRPRLPCATTGRSSHRQNR
jgi:hypothetical protein